MIKQLNTFKLLCDEIECDRTDASPLAGRYPIRLILLNSFQSLLDLADYLSGRNIDVLNLDTLFDSEDQWLTPDEIVNTLKELKRDTLVAPLSELLRFFPPAQFISVMTGLFEIENPHGEYKRRIYIPLTGLKERVEKEFLERCHRKHIYSPPWHLDTPPDGKRTVYQLDARAKIPAHSPTLKTTRDWLNLWKKEGVDKIISVSPALSYLSENFLPDALFVLEKIDTPKQYLQKIMGIAVTAAYAEAEKSFWGRLIEEIENHEENISDFSHYVHCHLNINNLKKLSAGDLLTLWIQNNEPFERWLIKLWFFLFGDKNTEYFQRIMASISHYTNEEIISKMWFDIFDMASVTGKIAKERRSYLHVLHGDCGLPFKETEEKIRYKLKQLPTDPITVPAQYISGISLEERKYLAAPAASPDEKNESQYRRTLQRVYPELYHYLNWADFQADAGDSGGWIKEYFREYTLSKLLNRRSGRLQEIIKEKNADEKRFYHWYYALKPANDIPKDAFIIWIDGLGAEWFPLLEFLIEQHKDRFIEKKEIRRVNLPSVTQCNRLDTPCHILELDDYIHHENPYKHPEDLVKQIDLLKRIVEREIMGKTHDKILITSDHGFTFLARKQFGNRKKFDFADADHEGRCMWTEENYQSGADFIVHTADDGRKALVSLAHASLCNTPAREVHGGATPEEVLVPWILVSKVQDHIRHTVKLITKEISVKHPVIKIEIEPEPQVSPYLILENKRMKYIKDEGQWRVSLKGFKPGTYSFFTEILNRKTEHAVLIKGGIQEKELF